MEVKDKLAILKYIVELQTSISNEFDPTQAIKIFDLIENTKQLVFGQCKRVIVTDIQYDINDEDGDVYSLPTKLQLFVHADDDIADAITNITDFLVKDYKIKE